MRKRTFFRRRVETKDVSIQVELNATTPNDTDIQTASMQMYDDPHENPNGEETPDLEQVIRSMEDFGNTIDDPMVRNRRVVENSNEESTPENTDTNNENDIEKDLGPIIEYAQVSLLPLFKACAPLEDILHNLSFYVQMALNETPEEPHNGLTIDESAAIRLYTIEWSSPHRSLYSMLNHTLKREDHEHLRPYFKYNHQYYQKNTSYYD